MAIYDSSGNRLGLTDPTVTSTTALVPLGTIRQFYDTVIADNGEYMYVQFGGTITVGMVLVLDNTIKAVAASSTTHAGKSWPIGFAIGSAVDTDYGWVKISGKVKAKAATVAAGANVFLTTTAGTIDDAQINGSQILGTKTSTADGTPAAGFCYIHCDRPASQGQIA